MSFSSTENLLVFANCFYFETGNDDLHFKFETPGIVSFDLEVLIDLRHHYVGFLHC